MIDRFFPLTQHNRDTALESRETHIAGVCHQVMCGVNYVESQRDLEKQTSPIGRSPLTAEITSLAA